jgi:hypothetical protein
MDPVTLILSIINQSLIMYNGLPQAVKDTQAAQWQSLIDGLVKLGATLHADLTSVNFGTLFTKL